MTSPLNRLRGEFDALKQRRDELRLQAHLFNAEIRKEWERLEKDWKVISRNIKEMEPVLSRSAKNISESTEPLVKELRNAYERIKSELKELNS